MCNKIRALAFLLLALVGSAAWSQTVYGVGDATGGGTTYNRLFSVNTTTGVATNLCGLSFQSAAMAVSPVNGLIYYFEYNTANPDMNTITPGCTNGTAVATTLPTGIIRATFCPDGRLYASSNTATIYEINPATGATVRSFGVTGLPAQGSGDFACVNSGGFYVLGTANNTAYRLYRANADIGSVANGGSLAFTDVGPLNLTGTPNGLTEITGNPASCAASPNPCLIASTGTTNRIWGIDVLTGDADQLPNNTGHVLTDLSRSYPLDVAVVKSASPATVLQGETITYLVTVSNNGPAVAANVTVTDVLSASLYESVSWTCAVLQAGSATMVTTACSAGSGSGSINNTVSLSIGGQVRYTVLANVTDTFTGVASNAASATVSVLLTDTDPSNNRSTTASSTVTPAAHLAVMKTNSTNTLIAGQTTSYTIQVVNDGPADAPGTVVRDPAAPGLNCTSVSFSSNPPGGATVAGLSISALQSTGVALTPTFDADTTATFTLTCDVTATGQ